jgi:hypothetical protein
VAAATKQKKSLFFVHPFSGSLSAVPRLSKQLLFTNDCVDYIAANRDFFFNFLKLTACLWIYGIARS